MQEIKNNYNNLTDQNTQVLTASSNAELDRRAQFYNLFNNSPIPSGEKLDNLGLYLKRQSLSRILFMHEMYKKIINVHGSIMEFGVRWGQNLSLFHSFRGMYEPYNYNRKIIGFDTFEGFPSVHEKDGNAEIIKQGSYGVTENYQDYLTEILNFHQAESPIPHIKKFDLIKGDATVTIKEYLKNNPETIVALAYFDFDIYEPTKVCLEAIAPHLTKGSVIGFDELNFHDFPGETLALKEVFGLDKYRIQRDPNSPHTSYIVIE